MPQLTTKQGVSFIIVLFQRLIIIIVFLTSDGGPIKAIPFADGAINILSKPRKKDDFINLANRLQLISTGTVAELKERLNRYSLSPKSTYHQNNIKLHEVHFWHFERQPSFESILCADDELIYVARKDIQGIVSFQVEKDGIGLRGVNMQEIIKVTPNLRGATFTEIIFFRSS